MDKKKRAREARSKPNSARSAKSSLAPPAKKNSATTVHSNVLLSSNQSLKQALEIQTSQDRNWLQPVMFRTVDNVNTITDAPIRVMESKEWATSVFTGNLNEVTKRVCLHGNLISGQVGLKEYKTKVTTVAKEQKPVDIMQSLLKMYSDKVEESHGEQAATFFEQMMSSIKYTVESSEQAEGTQALNEILRDRLQADIDKM